MPDHGGGDHAPHQASPGPVVSSLPAQKDQDLSEYTFVMNLSEYTFVMDLSEYTFVMNLSEYTFVKSLSEYTFVIDLSEYTLLWALVSITLSPQICLFASFAPIDWNGGCFSQ